MARPFRFSKLMNTSPFRAALRRAWEFFAGSEPRKTLVLPAAVHSMTRQALPKPSPVNLRRFGETPVARKAINTIKDRIAGMQDRKSTRLNSSHIQKSRMPSSA